MYKEIEKFKTGKKIKGIGVLPDKQEVKIYYNEYVANLGDLMEDFINHQKKPFWRRKYYHNHLTKIYKDMLNKIKITHGL
jgi:predicted small metal-binding protein